MGLKTDIEAAVQGDSGALRRVLNSHASAISKVATASGTSVTGAPGSAATPLTARVPSSPTLTVIAGNGLFTVIILPGPTGIDPRASTVRSEPAFDLVGTIETRRERKFPLRSTTDAIASGILFQVESSPFQDFSDQVSVYGPAAQMVYHFATPNLSLFWRVKARMPDSDFTQYVYATSSGIIAAFSSGVELVDPSTPQLLKKGSVPPVCAPGFTYVSDDTSITISWTLLGYRTDANLTPFSETSSQVITGLAVSSSFNFYLFWDETTQTVKAVTTGGTGVPAWAHVGTNRIWTAEQARQDHIPLSDNPFVASTTAPAAPPGGGSGGGDGGCLRSDMFVRIRGCEKPMRATDVREGNLLWSENDTWLRVVKVERRTHDVWVRAAFNNDAAIVVTAMHPFTRSVDRETIRASALSLDTPIPCPTGDAYPRELKLMLSEATKVAIELEAPHVFYASEDGEHWILTHNLQHTL